MEPNGPFVLVGRADSRGRPVPDLLQLSGVERFEPDLLSTGVDSDALTVFGNGLSDDVVDYVFVKQDTADDAPSDAGVLCSEMIAVASVAVESLQHPLSLSLSLSLCQFLLILHPIFGADVEYLNDNKGVILSLSTLKAEPGKIALCYRRFIVCIVGFVCFFDC